MHAGVYVHGYILLECCIMRTKHYIYNIRQLQMVNDDIVDMIMDYAHHNRLEIQIIQMMINF